jgi:DNA-binding transcriptional LysR family regulator
MLPLAPVIRMRFMEGSGGWVDGKILRSPRGPGKTLSRLSFPTGSIESPDPEKMDELHKRWPGLLAAVRTADTGSFSQAARQLNLTPAAVGKSVAQLEAKLGVRLFNRTTRQLSLTEEGERVVGHARAAMQALAQAGAVAERSSELRGLVRISSAVGFGRRYVLPAVAGVLNQHPGLRIELSLSDHTVDLVKDGFDIGIRGGSTPPQGMVAQRICRMPTRLVASAVYLQRHGVPADWTALRQHRTIGVRFASGRTSEWSFRSGNKVHTLDLTPALLLSAPELVVDAALQHQGIAQAALHHAWDALDSGALQTVLPQQHVPGAVAVAIFYPHRSGLALRVRTVVDLLLAHLRADANLSRPSKPG